MIQTIIQYFLCSKVSLKLVALLLQPIPMVVWPPPPSS